MQAVSIMSIFLAITIMPFVGAYANHADQEATANTASQPVARAPASDQSMKDCMDAVVKQTKLVSYFTGVTPLKLNFEDGNSSFKESFVIPFPRYEQNGKGLWILTPGNLYAFHRSDNDARDVRIITPGRLFDLTPNNAEGWTTYSQTKDPSNPEILSQERMNALDEVTSGAPFAAFVQKILHKENILFSNSGSDKELAIGAQIQSHELAQAEALNKVLSQYDELARNVKPNDENSRARQDAQNLVDDLKSGKYQSCFAKMELDRLREHYKSQWDDIQKVCHNWMPVLSAERAVIHKTRHKIKAGSERNPSDDDAVQGLVHAMEKTN